MKCFVRDGLSLTIATYTNTENHPGVIGLRSAAEKRRRAEARAQAQMEAEATVPLPKGHEEEDAESDSGSETERDEPRVTVARPKGETAEEKKARKAAVKAERSVSSQRLRVTIIHADYQSRRAEKKAHTATFGEERKKQLATHKKMVGGGRAADVTVGVKGVVSLR